MTDTELLDMLHMAAARLGEHFDAVQILCSKNEHGMTSCMKSGTGNWYARQGMAHEFINADMAQENARQISEALADDSPPDPEDHWKEV